MSKHPCSGPTSLLENRFRFEKPNHTRMGKWLMPLLLLMGLVLGGQTSFAADFTVAAVGVFPTPTSYRINGTSGNPTLTLVRGETYTFAVNTGSTHPFRIKSLGVTSNNIFNGTITFKVPMVASNYFYDCSIHGFGGAIVTVAPPTFRLVKLDVGSNVVLKSTGATNWVLSPQFSTNLGSTNWFALTVQSNRFLNGTNETFCGRPPGTNVFIRLKAQRN